MLSIKETVQTASRHKLSILFVDDDDEVRESMARYLGRRVDKVRTAHNGEAGLSSFMGERPDLVISDIRMGKMDGLAMCREIREKAPDIPLVLISAHNESEVLLSSIDLGVTKFIVKPVDAKVLMNAIGSVAEALEQQRNLESRLQQMDFVLSEADYESENVKRYISQYLEADHHDEIASVKHLNIPKLGVSGDFYSVAKHQDDLYVMLADGAGHGLSAVLPALHIPRLFQQQAARGFSLLTIAAELNRFLHEQHFVEHFVAATFIRINPSEHFIEVLNCSNPPVVICAVDGALLHLCHSHSTALGMLGDENFSAKLERFNMEHRARIYLFTDGLTDTLQACSKNFDFSKLQSLIESSSPKTFDVLSAQIEDAAKHCKVDDITLLEISFNGDQVSEIQGELSLGVEVLSEGEPPVELRHMTLLYVEDDETTRDYLAFYLNRRFAMVHVAKNGQEGLALFKKYRPQVVLSDIKMPKMNGLEMAEEIRKLNKKVPIIVISGSDHAENAEKMFEMGVSRFHVKPLDLNKLNKTIQACVQQANTLDRLLLSATVFEASSLALVTAGLDRRIVTINPAFTRVTGYTLDEVIGHSPMLLSSGGRDIGYFQVMWKTLEETGHWSGEFISQHKNGLTASEWMTVDGIRGEDGVVTGYHFIFSDSSERQVSENKMRDLSRHDSLTHLPNREMLAEKINDYLGQSGMPIQGMTLVYINIDRFIEINNVLGVHIGDAVLFTVAQRLLTTAGQRHVVCRMGGDEFAVLMLEENGSRDAIEQTVLALSQAIKQPISVNSQEVQLRISMGISQYPSDGDNYEELIQSACSAMSQAQLTGGDTYRFFDRSISQREEKNVILQQGIKAGLLKNEFYMLYQPKYSLSQQRIVGAEALMRWKHPTLGFISPAEFIPLAEKNATIIEMSEWLIDTVCVQLAEWRSRGIQQVPVSINISPVHFWRGDLVTSLQSGLQKCGIPPYLLPIEVTEGVVMDSSAKTLEVLAQLRTLGFHLSIDDFGTGYSSLKYLKDLPISELKIDRSFVIEIPEEGQPNDLSKTAIPRAIIKLASELNLTVVAEGVETENQMNFLLENGCDVIQGYLFSKPISAEEFALLLEK